MPAFTLHPANLRLALILVQGRSAQVTPPLEQHRVANQLKPRGELQAGLLKHCLQLVGGDIAGIPDFVQVGIQVNICLNEENVVH